MVKCLNIGKNIGQPIYRSISNQNIEKIAFTFVRMKFLAMHIPYQKGSFYIFTVRHLLNIFMEHDLYLMS